MGYPFVPILAFGLCALLKPFKPKLPATGHDMESVALQTCKTHVQADMLPTKPS